MNKKHLCILHSSYETKLDNICHNEWMKTHIGLDDLDNASIQLHQELTKKIDDNKKYKVTYLNSAFYYNELVKNIYPKQGIEAFAMREKALRDEWIEYIKEGNTLSKPTDYILVK